MRRHFIVATLAAGLIAFPGCRKENTEPLTTAEAQQALEEAAISNEASVVISSTIEISTNFTIGQAVKDAAEELRSFIESQLPCAEIVLEDSTLSIEYGALEGNCTYRGQTFSGIHSVTVDRNEEGGVVVEHGWDELSNGKLSVTGDATVTWSLADATRHVEHELTWTRLSDGRTGVGRGDRLQRALPGGIVEGFQVDGERSWTGDAGAWELAIDGVQMRWVDPVPQDGKYTLVTPNNKSLTMEFDRVDEDTIAVIIKNGDKELRFNVNSLGAISSEE